MGPRFEQEGITAKIFMPEALQAQNHIRNYIDDNLSVTGSGRILVNRTGGGRLILYVADRLELAGSGKINPGF